MRDAAAMIDVDVIGAAAGRGRITSDEVRALCTLAAERMDVTAGHVAVEFVDADRIAELNREHRGRDTPTDVLSFPVDGVQPLGEEGSRELGDIVISPEHTVDLREAVLHGMLHLLGMDHEADDGEMLGLQDELLAIAPSALDDRPAPAGPPR